MCGANPVMSLQNFGDVCFAGDFNKASALHDIKAVEHGKEA